MAQLAVAGPIAAAHQVAAPRRPAAAAVAAAAPCCQVRQQAAPQQRQWNSSSSSSLRGGSRRKALVNPPAAAAVPEVAAAELEPAGQEQWAACSALVQQQCGLDADAADAALLKAFGWKGQAFWRQERVKQVPCPDQVAAALDFLAGQGISEPADLAPLLRTFPEALGLRVEVMAENVGVLRDKWFMKGNVLTNAIKRKPRVLGNCIDCQGTCAGLCTRCWAQF